MTPTKKTTRPREPVMRLENEEGKPTAEIIRKLKALVDAGRGDEPVTFTDQQGYERSAPAAVAYAHILRFAQEELGLAALEADEAADETVTTMDSVRRLRTMIATGRGGEHLELRVQPVEGETLDKLEGTAQTIYRRLVAIEKRRVGVELAKVRAALDESRRDAGLHAEIAPGGPVESWGDRTQRWLRDARQDLVDMPEFADEAKQVDACSAEIASLIPAVLPTADAGAGKVRVLDEHRVARDPHTEVRDFPLADKLARMADAETRKAFLEENADAKELIRHMTGQPLIKAVEMILDEAFPELMKAFYPRIYGNIGRYHSPRSMAAMMANVVAEMLRYGYQRSATAYKLLMPGLAYLRERRMPMFFLAPDLLEAVQRTDFDDDINWVDVELPYETGILMLPKGALVHPTDGEVGMLMWSRVRAGEHPAPWPGIPVSVLPHDVFILMGACPETMIWYDSILTADVRRVMRLNNLFYRAPGEAAPNIKKSNFMDADLTEEDQPFVERMGVLVFGTILAMNARPMLVEHGKLLKRVGTGPKLREFWSPNVIGAKYKFKREVPRVIDRKFVAGTHEHGTHASPRMHWRRGHYRNQPVGPGRKERKNIWIEPCLIGAGEEE